APPRARAPPAGAPAAPEATAASQAAGALPVCGEVFVPDQKVSGFDEQKGCTGKDGTVQFIGAIECSDGTKLWPVDASTGAPTGYGREGQVYRVVKGEVQADNGYKQAYEECMKEAPGGASAAPSAAAG
ncbi:hypothetical protein, partial [Actinoplanes philippinensis]|uniref:hypothetical protein n=1 Tax=Actinoplanes philippinensis TaxID=35752 RepID=UPI003408A340